MYRSVITIALFLIAEFGYLDRAASKLQTANLRREAPRRS
jgi:hypothetical protein